MLKKRILSVLVILPILVSATSCKAKNNDASSESTIKDNTFSGVSEKESPSKKSTSEKQPVVVYEENFDNVSDFRDLNWQETLYSNDVATWTVENGQVVVDNYTVKAQGGAAYIMVPKEIMDGVFHETYEVSADLTILDADKDSRWCAVLLNHKDEDGKGKRNQTRIAFRVSGNGAFESYTYGENNGTTHKSGVWEMISYPPFSEELTPPRWLFDERFNVRIVVDYETTTVRIYIDGNLTAVSALDTWEAFTSAAKRYSSIAFYAADNIMVGIDNVKVTAYR